MAINAEAGPSSASIETEGGGNRRASTKTRTITLHPASSASNLIFPATSSVNTRYRHVRTQSGASQPATAEELNTPRRSHRAAFLREDSMLDAGTRRTEQVDLPDFGHMFGINDDVEDHFAIATRIRTRWKRKLYLLMEEPASGREAFLVHVIVTGAILFSAVLTTLSTLPAFHTSPIVTKAFFGLDTTIVVLFTIEYIARSLAHSDKWSQYYSWATSFFGILDLLAILPYYIEVAQKEDTTILFRFSILRTFRLLRVFRAFRYQNQMLLTIEVMYVAVKRSKDALWALSFFIILFLVLFSTLIYFAERGTWDPTVSAFIDADGDPSAFDSIPKTAWFSLVTMSTVGYGEVVPKSFLGKLLTIPLLMFGLLLIALPSFVLGRNFAIVYDAMTSQLPQNMSPISSPSHSTHQIDTLPGTTGDIPLLPTSISHDPNAPQHPDTTPPQSLRPAFSRSVSSLPSGSKSISTGQGDAGHAPRMWEGGVDGTRSTLGSSSGNLGDKPHRDLTNTKLAKNQLVLLGQIDSLRQTLEKQGELLSLLTEALGVTIPVNKLKDKETEIEKVLDLGDADEEK
ncbi:hypothetical protein L204_104645 [Cryptococcus depauperatus]|nr:hypothetical protein L204_03509 [Cryptococcus depauperatus CBS 7855]